METAKGTFLRFFVGNMASGKTRHLLLEIDTLKRYGNKRVIAFKPATDTRSGNGKLQSRRGDEDEACEVHATAPWEVAEELQRRERAQGRRFEIVAFDEVQFFARDSGFFQLVQHLLDRGYDVIAAGLMFDFRGEPFGSTADLALLARDKCVWLHAYCTVCGAEAAFPQRLIDGAPAPYDSPQICVGGDETYQPRCRSHFVLPGRPR